MVPHLCGAILFASKKTNGGLRPIAVGEVLRRLTSKCVSRAVCGDAVKFLTPLQLGVGVSVVSRARRIYYVFITLGGAREREKYVWCISRSFHEH